MVERETPYTIQNLLFSPKPIKQYLPIFEVDYDFDVNEDLYTLFLGTIKSITRKGFSHCILIIKENFNDTLIVLDPNHKNPSTVNMHDFFQKYACTGVESFCDVGHGGTVFFNEHFLKHLLND